MDSLVASLNARPPHLLADDSQLDGGDASIAQWGSSGGFGNLMENGVVRGMEIPRVPDVSLRPIFHLVKRSTLRSPLADELPLTPPHLPPERTAISLPITPHRLDVIQQPSQDQARPRDHHLGF